MGKFSQTWNLMKESWELLKKDKELLILPLISGILCLVVMASFVYPMVKGQLIVEKNGNQINFNEGKYYVLMFLFYFFSYFIIVFFNSAIVAAVMIRLKGGNPTIRDGLGAAMSMLPLIVAWAFVAATVGIILRMIEDKSELLGKIVAGVLGLAWSVVTFLVVPILVIEQKGPFAAVKESARLLKKTWGEQIIGRFSFGLVFFVLGIPAYLLFFLGASTKSMPMIIMFGALALIYLIILSLIQSALQSIFQVVVYHYVTDKQVPQGFNPVFIDSAFGRKPPTKFGGGSFSRF
ncbi:MAG: hypothetical protein JW737_09215 [Acidobacteria bacterium]|nr:hypothetical protein [Acidobacteriota bacterium]